MSFGMELSSKDVTGLKSGESAMGPDTSMLLLLRNSATSCLVMAATAAVCW
jgi:hypothetical protein